MRVLVVGLGKMGAFHVDALNRLGSTTGTVDIAGHADYESISSAIDAEPWDAAVIATPISTLFGAAMLTVDAGIATLVEKPGGATCDQVTELAGFSQERGVMVSVGWIERYNPVVRVVRETIRTLGDPVSIETRRIGPTGGQNATLDLAVHDIDLVRFLGIDAPHQMEAAYVPHRKERTLVVNCAHGSVEADLRRRTVKRWLGGVEMDVFVPDQDPLLNELARFLVAVSEHGPAPCPIADSLAVLKAAVRVEKVLA